MTENPWIPLAWVSTTTLVRVGTGPVGAQTIDMVNPVLTSVVTSMRTYENYRMVTNAMFEHGGLLALNIVTAITLFPSIGQYAFKLLHRAKATVTRTKATKNDGTKHEDTRTTRQAMKSARETEDDTCQAIVGKSGCPCTKRGTTQHDGHWVCGVHARSSRVTYR